MAHDHPHHHGHGPAGPGSAGAATRRRLAWTLGLVTAYMGAEVVGGLLTNSLALLADAGHMLSDAASLGLALFAARIALRPRTAQRTFGYHRGEILAALANGVALVVVAIFVIVEAWGRFQSPPQVQGAPMLGIAAGGLAVNLASLAILHRGRDESLNVRGAWLHVLTDALGSVQAIAAGALIWAFGWNWADPLASVLIGLLVIWSAWSLLSQTVHVLMEGSPENVDPAEIEAALQEVGGVQEVHDLHVWTITSGFVSLSAHVTVEERDPTVVLGEVRRLLMERFDIGHSTIQVQDTAYCAFGDCERVEAGARTGED